MKQRVVRPVYSSPPLHGALLAAAVLSDEQLFAQWEGELRAMATRVRRMRALLAEELRRVGAPSPDGGDCAPRRAAPRRAARRKRPAHMHPWSRKRGCRPTSDPAPRPRPRRPATRPHTHERATSDAPLRSPRCAAGGHITSQIGMFAYTGLRAHHVDAMRARWHVYLTRDGRMSMAGMKPGDVAHVARAIHAVLA